MTTSDDDDPVTLRRIGRRVGFAVAAIIDIVLLLIVNVWPGWDVLPLVTEDAGRLVDLVNASLVVALGFNVVRVGYAPRWVTAIADAVGAAFAVAIMVRLLQVFPFDVADGGFWELVIRGALVLVLVGAAIGVVVNVVKLARDPRRDA